MIRVHLLALLAVAACLAACLPARGQAEGTVADLVGKAASNDAEERAKAFEGLVALGEEGITGVLAMLAEPAEGGDAGARITLHGMACRSIRVGAEEERAALVKPLAAFLAGEGPAAVKRFVIEQLHVAGRGDAVPALVVCLADEELAESARQALIANPSREALAALRGAGAGRASGCRGGVAAAGGGRHRQRGAAPGGARGAGADRRSEGRAGDRRGARAGR